jgi:shikimate dehydrogenase
MLKTGLVGRAIKASRSPWLHEQEAKAQGVELRYELFDFNELGRDDAELAQSLRALAAEGFLGVNVTYPFKQAVLPLLDALAPCAASVGAVNTVAMRQGKLVGYNTDKTGFEQSLAEGLPEADLGAVLQLGAGGAGSAVANALLSLGVGQLEISDIDEARAAELAARLNTDHGASRVKTRDYATLDTAGIAGIVNTSPMGMVANPGPAINPDLIESRHWVADIVYFPLETQLLQLARAKGCRTLDGSGMVIGQAAAAFDIFTGLKAERARMRATF